MTEIRNTEWVFPLTNTTADKSQRRVGINARDGLGRQVASELVGWDMQLQGALRPSNGFTRLVDLDAQSTLFNAGAGDIIEEGDVRAFTTRVDASRDVGGYVVRFKNTAGEYTIFVIWFFNGQWQEQELYGSGSDFEASGKRWSIAVARRDVFVYLKGATPIRFFFDLNREGTSTSFDDDTLNITVQNFEPGTQPVAWSRDTLPSFVAADTNRETEVFGSEGNDISGEPEGGGESQIVPRSNLFNALRDGKFVREDDTRNEAVFDAEPYFVMDSRLDLPPSETQLSTNNFDVVYRQNSPSRTHEPFTDFTNKSDEPGAVLTPRFTVAAQATFGMRFSGINEGTEAADIVDSDVTDLESGTSGSGDFFQDPNNLASKQVQDAAAAVDDYYAISEVPEASADFSGLADADSGASVGYVKDDNDIIITQFADGFNASAEESQSVFVIYQLINTKDGLQSALSDPVELRVPRHRNDFDVDPMQRTWFYRGREPFNTLGDLGGPSTDEDGQPYSLVDMEAIFDVPPKRRGDLQEFVSEVLADNPNADLSQVPDTGIEVDGYTNVRNQQTGGSFYKFGIFSLRYRFNSQAITVDGEPTKTFYPGSWTEKRHIFGELVVSDDEKDEGLYDTIRVFRTLPQRPGIPPGTFFQAFEESIADCKQHVTQGTALDNDAEFSRCGIVVTVSDGALQRRGQPLLDTSTPLVETPKAGAAAFYDGSMVISNIEDDADVNNSIGEIRYSRTRKVDPLQFFALDRFIPKNPRDSVIRFAQPGGNLIGFSENGQSLIRKSGGFIRFEPMHAGYGIQSDRAVAEAANIVYFVSSKGLGATSNEAALEDIPAMDALIQRQWSDDWAKLQVAYDPQINALFVLNPVKEAIAVLWFRTAAFSEFVDTRFIGVESGPDPTSDSGVVRAQFFDSIGGVWLYDYLRSKGNNIRLHETEGDLIVTTA